MKIIKIFFLDDVFSFFEYYFNKFKILKDIK